MTRTMTIAEAIAHFRAMREAIEQANAEGVRSGLRTILHEAREIVGDYQRQDTGPFHGWDELAERTKVQRVSLGYTANDPGQRSGAMRESYGERLAVHGPVAAGTVGSDMPEAVWFERGTFARNAMGGDDHRQPPRSVLGVAAYRMEHQVVQAVVGRVLLAMKGGNGG